MILSESSFVESGIDSLRILLVEDQDLLGDAVRDYIASTGHAVDWLKTIADCEAALSTVNYSLILLDLNLPDGSGIDLLRELRKRGNTTPVIILTARDQVRDRIEGLNSGADDYLVKPFDLDELGARIHAVSRRMASVPFSAIKCGDLIIEREARRVILHGELIDLTAKEWIILEELIRHPGVIVSKEKIEDALYAFGSEIESNTVEVYVSRLRKKIGAQAIVTSRGLGYRMETNS